MIDFRLYMQGVEAVAMEYYQVRTVLLTTINF